MSLEKVYARLRKNPDDNLNGLKLYHSDIYYVRAHLEEKFHPRKFTLKETYILLDLEGMLSGSSRNMNFSKEDYEGAEQDSTHKET